MFWSACNHMYSQVSSVFMVDLVQLSQADIRMRMLSCKHPTNEALDLIVKTTVTGHKERRIYFVVPAPHILGDSSEEHHDKYQTILTNQEEPGQYYHSYLMINAGSLLCSDVKLECQGLKGHQIDD